ncbi:MAG: patatin-like phospholipase family protein [Rhizobiaceae bacterium]
MWRYSNQSVLLPVMLAITLFLSGCVSRPAESPNYRDVLPQDAVALDHHRSNYSPPEYAGDRDTETILALSGGGAYGAFGVGMLNAWTAQGTRPNFDVVTGVSTGALMSVFAFLGPEYDAVMRDVYINTDERDIFTERGVSGLLSDSLYDNTPLKRRIEQYVTPQLLSKIAAEHAKGRRLYVGTTNLDAGELVVWDMGKIASGGRSNPLQHFQKILRASAAVPGFFPPVYIKPKRGVQLRQAHVDGGVKAPVLINDFLFLSPVKKRKLYVIVNDNISQSDAYAAVDGSLASIARKTIATLTKELLIQTVYRGYVRAARTGTEFHLAAVPKKLGANAQSLSFEKTFLRRLYQAGVKHGSGANPWVRKPRDLRKFDEIRIARR